MTLSAPHSRNYAIALERKANRYRTMHSTPYDLGVHIVTSAYSLVGQLEDPPGSNRGDVILWVRSLIDRDLPADERKSGAWCAYFVHGVIAWAADRLNAGEPTTRVSGSVSNTWKRNHERVGVDSWDREQWLHVCHTIEPAGLIFCRSGSVSNHTGLIVGRYGTGDAARLLTVEGNTTPESDDEDGGRGGGVFAKTIAPDDPRIFGVLRPKLRTD